MDTRPISLYIYPHIFIFFIRSHECRHCQWCQNAKNLPLAWSQKIGIDSLVQWDVKIFLSSQTHGREECWTKYLNKNDFNWLYSYFWHLKAKGNEWFKLRMRIVVAQAERKSQANQISPQQKHQSKVESGSIQYNDNILTDLQQEVYLS